MSAEMRCDAGRRRSATARRGAVAALPRVWRQSLLDLALACLLAALPLGATAFGLVASWQKSGAYHYAWLTAPMFVYLVGWRYRGQILAQCPHPDWVGVLVAFVAAVGWSIATAAQIEIGRQLALVIVVHGIVWAAVGRRLYWRLLPIMGLLLLMLPSGDLLLPPLRWLTLKSIEWFALACDLPYRSDAYSLTIGDNAYLVLAACSGLEPLLLTFFLGYCFALLVYNSLGKSIALAMFAASFGLLANVLRVNAIVWIDRLRGFQMDLAAHATIQWLALSLVLALFFRALLALRGDDPSDSPPPAAPQAVAPVGGRRAALLAGLAVLLVCGSASLRLGLEARAVPASAQSVLPAVIGEWRAVAPSGGWSAAGELRILAGAYQQRSRRLTVAIVEAQVAGAKLSLAPLLDGDANDWYEMGEARQRVCDTQRCVDLSHTLQRKISDASQRRVYYSYFVGDRQTSSTLVQRLTTAYSRLRGDDPAARLVAVIADGEPPPAAELVMLLRALAAAGDAPA